ncbi:hypothetical protein A4A49_28980 [Nicotiana attenuata]|uniref:G-patch domain-containing protein n=2 Tax=Nicotiana attenuata TaxID=49451 RepID=A0A1J6I0Z1_NICAT|nr:hypothetical protein A4A49_28980 [Nicotiana attenuata]
MAEGNLSTTNLNLVDVTISSVPTLALPTTDDPRPSRDPETHLEVIARLEQKIAELSYIVQQNRSFSQTPPHMTPLPHRIRENMPIPPPFPNLDGLNRENQFTAPQPIQNVPLTHSVTQNAPLQFTTAPPKVQYTQLTHDVTNTQQVSPIYTYATVPPMTQTLGPCRLDVDHYVEAEKEARAVDDEIINRKLKSLEDAMRGLLYPVEGRIPNPLPRSFDPTKTCAYHSGVKGHSTDRCYALKHKVEDLIEAKQIKIRQPAPNVNNNPLPNHNEASVNMIGVDEEDDDPARFIVPVRSMEDHTFVAFTSPMMMIRGFTPIEILGVASTPVEVLQAPIQLPVVDTRVVPWNYQQAVMECHGKETTIISGMTRSGRCYTLEKLTRLSQGNECNVPPKKVVTDAEAQEFLRKIKAAEGSQTQEPKMSCAAIMVAKEMLKNGYQPGLGLGKTLNGRVEPIVPPGQQFSFGLGYKPTQQEVKEARQKKGKEIHLPKSIPTIDQTFLKPAIVQTPGVPVEISCDDIIKGVKNLLVGDEDDRDMVFADIAETPTTCVVEPGFVLKNWTCISALVRQEFQ